MSTRVHELAKELGLKSPDLLDRIQKWGLDVKVSALASLDPATVDRIKRELMGSGPALRLNPPRRAGAPRTSADVEAHRRVGTVPVPAAGVRDRTPEFFGDARRSAPQPHPPQPRGP